MISYAGFIVLDLSYVNKMCRKLKPLTITNSVYEFQLEVQKIETKHVLCI